MSSLLFAPEGSITLEAETGLVGFPCVLESDDSSCEAALAGKGFVITKTHLKGEEVFSCPGRLCLNESITGDSLIIYDNGLVILLDEGRHVFAIHAISKPFSRLFKK